MLGKILSIIPSLQLPGFFFFFYKILFADDICVCVCVSVCTCICVGIHSCVHLQRAEEGSRHPPLLPSNYSFEAGSLPERKVCVYFIVLLCFGVCLGLKAASPTYRPAFAPFKAGVTGACGMVDGFLAGCRVSDSSLHDGATRASNQLLAHI